jgi:hypothetical protein
LISLVLFGQHLHLDANQTPGSRGTPYFDIVLNRGRASDRNRFPLFTLRLVLRAQRPTFAPHLVVCLDES